MVTILHAIYYKLQHTDNKIRKGLDSLVNNIASQYL